MRHKRRTVDCSLPVHVTRKVEKQFRHLVDQLAGSAGLSGQYLRENVFTKYLDEDLVPAQTRSEAAIKKWRACELRISRVNTHLLLLEGHELDLGWCGTDRLIKMIRRNVARILGPVPDMLAFGRATMSNGASVRVRRSSSASVSKLTGAVQLTERAIPLWKAIYQDTILEDWPLEVVASRSKLFTVPKKTDIDRVACMEPEGNMLLQRGVGIYIRDRLRIVGIDLRDQSRNKGLAQRGSKDRSLATIDLSSASDCVSTQLVTLLLPFEWSTLLSDLRVEGTILPDGGEHIFEMFSSMGNGFTFELESLIFYAIASAICRMTGTRGSISVYGDDIIVPTKVAARVCQILSLLGFIPNAKKTCIAGYLRESCGGHYWKGFDVTPFYLRKKVDTLPELINLLNNLLSWDGRGMGCFMSPEAYEFWSRWKDHVPKFLWGGIDPGDPSCLVTGDRPRMRLVPQTQKCRGVDPVAALATWYHRADVRDSLREEYDPLVVDPRTASALQAVPYVSLGERTSWTPGLCFGPD